MNALARFRLVGLNPVLAIALAIALPGCGGPDPAEQAQEPLSVVFDAFKRSDIEGALMLYAPTFFRSTPRQNWLQQLSLLHQQMGPVVSYEILTSKSEKKTNPVSGTYVQFECKVNYQKGSLRETFVLVRPDGLQHFTISGHAIQATAAQVGAPQGAPQPAPAGAAQPAPPAVAQPPAQPPAAQPQQPSPAATPPGSQGPSVPQGAPLAPSPVPVAPSPAAPAPGSTAPAGSAQPGGSAKPPAK